MRTSFTDMCGVEYPIMQGGMHHVGLATLAAAVSNAGGLGTITALSTGTPCGLREEIRKFRALSKNPFAVNLTILPMLSKVDYGGFIRVILEEGVRIVETAGRSPAEVIKPLKKDGIIIIHKCTSLRHAISAIKHGASMISMDGFEAAGHPGEDDVTNWTLLPLCAKKLSVPFLASGSCVSGYHLAAAMSMGAAGINMGTRFLCTAECPIRSEIKDAIVRGSELDTRLVMRSLKNTERVYNTIYAREVMELEKANPGSIDDIIHLVKGDNYKRAFYETGDAEKSVWSCGQGIGLIDRVLTCEELMRGIVDDATKIFKKNSRHIIGTKEISMM